MIKKIIEIQDIKISHLGTFKVEELEKRLENCSTATAQKQLQLDTMQQALEKLKRQVDRVGTTGCRPPPHPFLYA